MPPSLAVFDPDEWPDFATWRAARMDWARDPVNTDNLLETLRFLLGTRREAARLGLDTLGTVWVDESTGEVSDGR